MSDTATAAAHGIRIVLFDLDGTLADTAPDLADALNRTLELHGRPPLPYSRIRPEVSHGAGALIRLGFGGDFEPARQDLLRFYQADIHRKTGLFPGMEEVLGQLERHNIRWGVVTNKPSWLTNPLMAGLGLAGRAACVVSGDTTSNKKPHAEPILHACELAGGHAPGECLYIGDARRDIEAGHNAGAATLIALFGYLGENDRPDDWGADGAVERPEQILDWLVLPRPKQEK
ncbi:MAG TPA: HAD family hydrolase [Sedimenticola sp.]|nr:HAD family hydrolase [Sedimenticola sp.]